MNRLHNHHHHHHYHNGTSRNNNSGKKFRRLSNSNLENYENKLISYLNKLKNIFSNALFHQEDDDDDFQHHPEKGIRENTVSKFNKCHQDNENGQKKSSITMDIDVIHPAKYSSSNSPRPREEEDNNKAFNIVSAAIAYGIANNILEKIGNYFVLKNNNTGIAPRIGSYSQPSTPAPRYCRRCCNIHKCIKNPGSETVPNNCGRRSAPVNLNNSRNSSCYPSNNKLFHCPDCRELERVVRNY